MIVTIGGIPVYNAVISDEETGMFKISLVDDPAVMSNFMAFDNNKKPLMYAVQDEEKRLVRGVVMRADFPIYRRDDKLGEYYIIYKADQIRAMAEKYLLESRQNDVNLMHEAGSDVEGVQMVQYFIKGNGVAVEGFDDIADGSLFAEFHIVNDDVWAAVKEGTYKGYSLEGVFELVPETNKDEVEEIVDLLDGAFKRIFKHKNMSRLSKFRAELAKILAEFGKMTTDKGILVWDGSDDLAVGDAVGIEGEDGNAIDAQDGDYTNSEGVVFVVADGKIVEIKEDEPAAEEMATIATDKGDLSYEGELEVGTEVFVVSEEGEKAPAEDGDYKIEGKTLKVADGKVAEIVEDEPAEPEVGVEACKFSRIREVFEQTYEEKTRKVYEAIRATLGENEDCYIVECADDYAVADIYNYETGDEHFYRFALTWNDEEVALGDKVEVKPAFVPVDEEPKAEEEMAALKSENEDLKAQLAELKKMPAAKPAHQEVKASAQKTGMKGLDNLSRILSAGRK